MKKNFLVVLLTVLCLCCTFTACSVKVNTSVTDNDNSTSNVKDGKGTYERNFERTINGTKHSFYIYAASDDQYNPDQNKINAANLSFLYNITTNDFKIKSAEGKSPITQEQAQKIGDYLENHKVTWEQAIEVFDKMTENIIKGEDNIEKGLEFSSKNEEQKNNDEKANIGLDDIEINTMDANGNGVIERAFKKTVNGDTVQFYFYEASEDQPKVDKSKIEKANVAIEVNSSNGDFLTHTNYMAKLSKEDLEKIASEISKEANGVNDILPLFEEKVLSVLQQ